MASAEDATATQLRNIEESTGRTVGQWSDVVKDAGPIKHGEIVAYLKASHGMTHGNANLLAHKVREHLAGGVSSGDDLLEAQYSGAKAALRPVYEEVISAARGLGDDVTVVVQKTGVSLRRSRQFAVVQAAPAARIDLGLNLADTPPTDRLTSATGMCTHKVALREPSDVDAQVRAWLRAAYDRAGPTSG